MNMRDRIRQQREAGVSTAQKRAEEQKYGYEGTTTRLPENVKGYYKPREGINRFAVLPYLSKMDSETANEGEVDFLAVYYKYRQVGPDKKPYVCSSMTWGKPDYINDYLLQSGGDISDEVRNAYKPQKIGLFLIYPQMDKKEDEGLYFLDFSYANFADVLLTRIRMADEDDGWQWFYDTGEGGFDLAVGFEQDTFAGNKYMKAVTIDFKPRKKPLPDNVVEHGICLTDCIVETPYEKLKKIFLGFSSPIDSKKEDEPQLETSTNKEPEPPKKPIVTAESKGIKKNTMVKFRDQEMTVFKVGPDGTTVVLIDKDDEFIKDVEVMDVEVVSKESDDLDQHPASPKAKEVVDKPKATDGAWDEDWDSKEPPF